MSSAASVVIRRQNQYIDRFNRLGATDAEHAIYPEEVNIRRSFLFIRMVDRGVFVPCQDGRYYIDNQAAVRFKDMRRQRLMAVLIVIIFMIIIVYLLAGNL